MEKDETLREGFQRLEYKSIEVMLDCEMEDTGRI
jgi:hypothetical protein